MAELPAEIAPGPINFPQFPGGGLLAGLAKQSAVRQFAQLAALAGSVALGLAIVLWMRDPEMRPIAGSSDPQQALRITESLTAGGVPYEVHASTGLISVPAGQFHAAQMQLATVAGVDGRQLGYELLDRDQGFGISQFMEESNLRRGLEGELARSIITIRAVSSARVLLAMPRKTGFLRDRRRASAAVTLALYPGEILGREAAMGITKLVAGAVPELTPDRVTVLDQAGRLLTRSADQDRGAGEWQLEYVDRIEQGYRVKVENLLVPVLGRDGFIAEVAARIDFTAIEQTEELYNSDLPALRSEQLVDEERSSADTAIGVPGALTNQPPAVAAAAELQTAASDAAAAITGAAGGGSKRAESVRNYELDRTISHTRRMVGEIERLTVSIMVANRASAGAGSPTDSESANSAAGEAWTAAELESLTVAIRSAVGYDSSRGDLVTVINQPFQRIASVQIAEQPIYAKTWFASLTKQALGGIGLLALIFVLLRPLFKNLVDAGAPQLSAEAYIPAQGLPAGELPIGLPAPGQAQLTAPHSESYQTKVDTVRGLVSEDPARVAQVVKHWVADE